MKFLNVVLAVLFSQSLALACEEPTKDVTVEKGMVLAITQNDALNFKTLTVNAEKAMVYLVNENVFTSSGWELLTATQKELFEKDHCALEVGANTSEVKEFEIASSTAKAKLIGTGSNFTTSVERTFVLAAHNPANLKTEAKLTCKKVTEFKFANREEVEASNIRVSDLKRHFGEANIKVLLHHHE